MTEADDWWQTNRSTQLYYFQSVLFPITEKFLLFIWLHLSSKFHFEEFDLQLFAGCWPLWTYKTRCCAAVPDLCGSWTCAWPSFLSSTNCCRASTRGERLRGKVSVVQRRRASVQRQRVRFKTTSASLWAFSSSVTDEFVGFTITMREMSSDDASTNCREAARVASEMISSSQSEFKTLIRMLRKKKDHFLFGNLRSPRVLWLSGGGADLRFLPSWTWTCPDAVSVSVCCVIRSSNQLPSLCVSSATYRPAARLWNSSWSTSGRWSRTL